MIVNLILIIKIILVSLRVVIPAAVLVLSLMIANLVLLVLQDHIFKVHFAIHALLHARLVQIIIHAHLALILSF